MCGICGKISTRGHVIPEDLILKMTNSLINRGPDDSGIYQSHEGMSVALGHRRLSIVDLSPAGRQPMCNEDKSIWLVFNGEIYNHHELRRQLESKGHHFTSHTDSEVILHLYEEIGINCLKQLNGMFAFCLWDTKTQALYLCRDHVGIKPLVYCWDGESLSFASEIKSLLCDPQINTAMDTTALDLYLTFNYIPAPFTIYENIRKLPAGHFIELKNNKLSIVKYWDIPTDTLPQDFKSQQKKLYSLMEDSIRLQTQADVPLGAFLSGGIDSSIVVGLMSKLTSSKPHTFSIGFEGMPLFDETSYARQVANFHQTKHTEIILKASDLISTIPQLIHNLDEPFADSSLIPTCIISRETRKEIKVALSGEGGDELFAGYRMYTGEHLYQRYSKIPLPLRCGMIEPFIKALPDSRDNVYLERVRRLKKFINGSADSLEQRFFLWNQIFTQNERQALLKYPVANFETGKNIIHDLINHRDADAINRMLYCDFKNSLPNDMLTKVDRMSMLNGLEVRVPILDKRIVEYAFGLAGSVKLKGNQGKYIFRETFKDLLPPSLLKRPKTGFEIPIGAWLKKELYFLIDEYLSESKIQQQGIFNYAPIQHLIDDLMHNRRDTSWQLWNLIVFQAWNAKTG